MQLGSVLRRGEVKVDRAKWVEHLLSRLIPCSGLHFICRSPSLDPLLILPAFLFLWPPPQYQLWPVAKHRNIQPCPPATISRTNGSSLPHNPSSSNNVLLSYSHPVTFFIRHSTSTIIDFLASTSRHVRYHERQCRRWRQAPKTPQFLDPLSLRQNPRTAPHPSRPTQTDPGAG